MQSEKPQFSVISEEEMMPKTQDSLNTVSIPVMDELKPKSVESMFSRKVIWSGVIFIFFFSLVILTFSMYSMYRKDFYQASTSQDTYLAGDKEGISAPDPDAISDPVSSEEVLPTIEAIQTELDGITGDIQESDISDSSIGL